ncbi:endocuticle structural glycoprotein SgAbd-1-like [Venturia canescens]|uniref:endocuticle structural glycoprotein SgAbd-1-like n=1 Tax=Venturia canescens TaxID=32260 RepID=UPI001C9C6E90|nr:endocuticle structural glycoprotein SgAbd-1-like [Venturia canescens]
MSKIVFGLLALAAVVSAGLLPHEPVPIVRQEQDSSPDGSFSTRFETGNGISYQESGSLKSLGPKDSAQVSEGVVSYNAPDGTPIQLSWRADENGFQASGAHLPVAPPAPQIPEAIQRALAYIAAHPYVEPKKL